MKNWGYQTFRNNRTKLFGALICRKELHHYGKHTAYGERSKWRAYKWFNVPGEFTSRSEAVAAAKSAITTKLEGAL